MTFAPERHSRRSVLRGAFGAAAAGLALDGRPVAAFRGWCRSDPVLLIDDALADLFVTSSLRILLSVAGPTQIVVTVPANVTVALAVPGVGFGRGERVRFKRSRKLRKTRRGIQIQFAVRVPSRVDLPVGLEFAPRVVGILRPVRAKGAANQWIRMATTY